MSIRKQIQKGIEEEHKKRAKKIEGMSPQDVKNMDTNDFSKEYFNMYVARMKRNPQETAYWQVKDSCDEKYDTRLYNKEEFANCLCGLEKASKKKKKNLKDTDYCNFAQELKDIREGKKDG